jgi:hypothetical protein
LRLPHQPRTAKSRRAAALAVMRRRVDVLSPHTLRATLREWSEKQRESNVKAAEKIEPAP